MALRPLGRQRHNSPLVIGAFAACTLLFPHSTIHAQPPPEDISRKPIYDDLTLTRRPSKSDSTESNDAATNPNSPIDRYQNELADQIGRARRFIFTHTAVVEDRFNAFMSSVLHQEQAFTQTIASLAPRPETHEKLHPGLIYVFVSAMAGSIISRNRNILVRASAPFGIGIFAASYFLPHTTRNVADLVWTYEERAPFIAENHLRIRGAVEEGWRQSKRRAEIIQRWSEETVKEGRENVEGWIRKGN